MMQQALTPAEAREAYEPYAREAARRYGIPEDTYVALVTQESAWNPDVIYGRRVSAAGAQGIVQFMPETAAEMGINPLDPYEALDGGARYLASLIQEMGGDIALGVASYNAGPGRVREAVIAAENQQPGSRDTWVSFLPDETKLFLRQILQIQTGNEPSATLPPDALIDASDIPGVAAIETVGDFIGYVTNPQNIAKVALTGAGVLLVLAGVGIYVFGPSAVKAAAVVNPAVSAVAKATE